MVELRYFNHSDFQQLMSWVDSHAFSLQWSGSSLNYPLDEQQLTRYVNNANQPHSENLIYKAVDKETNKVVGHISLGKINRKNKTARICRILVGDEKSRGKGIGTAMIQEILHIAFKELGLHKVSLAVYDFNHSALACYKKVGFVTEGFIRECTKFNDAYWSYWEMSMLENEWHELNKEQG